jgi:hypothetical protein
MYVDWSIELGVDDPVLDFPWSGEACASDNASTLRYYDLKADPGLIDQLPEAQSSSELRKFLMRVNAAGFPLQSAKCDHWLTQEISEEEEIFDAPCKYACYVDLLFTSAEKQLSFAGHEEFAARLCDLLKGAPEMPASAEVIVRRCFYAAGETSANVGKNVDSNTGSRQEQAASEKNTAERPNVGPQSEQQGADQNLSPKHGSDSPAVGFYFTVYVSGFGETEAQSRQQWSIALTLVQHALVQSSKSLNL